MKRVSAQGMSAPGGVCPEECLPRGECVCLGDVYLGGCMSRGVSARHPSIPVNRMTEMWKNFTLPQLRCRR